MLSLSFSKCYLSWRYVEWSFLFEVKKHSLFSKYVVFCFLLIHKLLQNLWYQLYWCICIKCYFFKCFLQVFLIKCSRLVNQKDPMFRTQSSKLYKIFVKYIVHDHICRPSFMRKWSANAHKCAQDWWSSWYH